MDIKIKKIEEENDIRALAKAADVVWHECFEGIITTAQIDYMVEKFQSEKAMTRQILEEGYTYYALIYNDKIIGYTGIRPEEDRMFLSKLYVLKDYRGKGYANILLNKAFEDSRKNGLDKIYLTVNRNNKNAIELYLAKGFVIIEQKAADIGGGFVMDDYIMEKKSDK